MWQANHAADLLRSVAPARTVEFVRIETTGDQVRDRPLSQIGGDGLFTKEIQRALLEDRADIAVHSLKDMPTSPVEALVLAAVPVRGPVGDALVSRRHQSFETLPPQATLATSSLRRRAQVKLRRPDLQLVDIRGNVETRLRKLAEQNLDGLILAQAGLERLGLSTCITEILDPEWMLPAVGQGALGLECRADDAVTRSILEKLDHWPSSAAVRAERSLLRGLGGGCQVPIGAMTRLEGANLTLRGAVIAPDGSRRVLGEVNGPPEAAEALGHWLANDLLSQGAKELLASF
jgi:hydroxymethylbilane synthase